MSGPLGCICGKLCRLDYFYAHARMHHTEDKGARQSASYSKLRKSPYHPICDAPSESYRHSHRSSGRISYRYSSAGSSRSQKDTSPIRTPPFSFFANDALKGTTDGRRLA